jgi:hypothetical protein
MGVPLREFLLQKKFDAAITIDNKMQGTVPEFECREAAVYVHVSWKEWTERLDGWERACAVAHYRSSFSLKAHVEDAAERASKRREGRAKRRAARR